MSRLLKSRGVVLVTKDSAGWGVSAVGMAIAIGANAARARIMEVVFILMVLLRESVEIVVCRVEAFIMWKVECESDD